MFTTSDLFILLKLGIWKTGVIQNWGRVSLIATLCKEVNNNELTKYRIGNLDCSSYQKYFDRVNNKLICNNIYLIDFFQLFESYTANEYGYILVVKATIIGIEVNERIYFLKIENQIKDFSILGNIETNSTHKRKKTYRKRK